MMRGKLREWLPSEEKLRASPGLRWMGPLLRRPWLWQLNRRRVAAGAAIGVFFGLFVPLLQIAAAAGVAVLLRANLPVAAAATLVSNPLTYVPIWIAAYRTGSAILGESVDEQTAQKRAEALAGRLEDDAAHADPIGWAQRVADVGKPLVVGLSVFAVVGAAVTWAAVNVAWVVAVRLRRARRQRDPPPPT